MAQYLLYLAAALIIQRSPAFTSHAFPELAKTGRASEAGGVECRGQLQFSRVPRSGLWLPFHLIFAPPPPHRPAPVAIDNSPPSLQLADQDDDDDTHVDGGSSAYFPRQLRCPRAPAATLTEAGQSTESASDLASGTPPEVHLQTSRGVATDQETRALGGST
ncbi:hypothetical protein FDECE_16507 [Fusarium decemcellulare]|nr:hypothetical protein FDECE_16507 [Fusarium decemcellulare]